MIMALIIRLAEGSTADGNEVVAAADMESGEVHAITITCPGGKKVFGGGAGNNAWTNLSVHVVPVLSIPSPNTSTFNTSTTEWTVGFINFGSDLTFDIDLAAYAVCATAP